MASEIKSIVLNANLYDIKDTKARLDIAEETANRESADNKLQADIANISSLAITPASNLNFSLVNENVNRVLFNSFTSTTKNAPVATAGFVMTHCISTTSAVQTAYCGKQIFTRTLSGTTWSDWVAMWNTEES